MRILAFLFCLLGTVACVGPKTVDKDGGLVIEVRFSDLSAGDGVKGRTAEVVLDRMNCAFVKNPVVRLTADGGGLHVELPGQDDEVLFSELVTKPGRFEIVECCTSEEILPVLYEINGRMAAMPEYAGTENPLFSRYLYLNTELAYSDTGMVPANESAEFMALMEQPWVRELFPRGARPALVKPEQDIHTFVVLKYPADGLAPITGDMIEQASVEESGWKEGDFTVNFRFAKPFHGTWAQLTRENIGRSLAMVIDGGVYSVPRVNDEITGGACQISGDFSLEQAGFISAIFNAGELPTPLETVSTEVIVK